MEKETDLSFLRGAQLNPSQGEAQVTASDPAKSHLQSRPPSGDSKLNWYIVKLTFAAGLGGLLFGYDTGTNLQTSCFTWFHPSYQGLPILSANSI